MRCTLTTLKWGTIREAGKRKIRFAPFVVALLPANGAADESREAVTRSVPC